MRKRNKFNAKRRTYNGHTFASGRELNRYKELLLLEQAGDIAKLALQPKYTIIPRQVKSCGKVERAAVYTADFEYFEGDRLVIEDVKSKATARLPDYVLRRKLMLHVYGIEVKEVL